MGTGQKVDYPLKEIWALGRRWTAHQNEIPKVNDTGWQHEERTVKINGSLEVTKSTEIKERKR